MADDSMVVTALSLPVPALEPQPMDLEKAEEGDELDQAEVEALAAALEAQALGSSSEELKKPLFRGQTLPPLGVQWIHVLGKEFPVHVRIWSTKELQLGNATGPSTEIAMTYPMWLIPARVLVDLRGPLLPHDEMMKKNLLVQWRPGHPRTVVLISHQWAGFRHPDPNMEQFQVLQSLLRNLAAGRVSIGKDMVAQSRGVDVPIPSTQEQRDCLEWDIWYDFFGIPQIDDRGCVSNAPELQAAVDSIPAYCHASDIIVILAPSLRHADTGKTISFGSWETRGWCRAERTAAALSDKNMPLLVVTTPRTIFASSGAAWIGSWPHDGEFTVEGDRKTASWQGVSVSVVSIVFRESQSASEGEATLVTLQVKELTKKLLALKSESLFDIANVKLRLLPERGCPVCHLAALEQERNIPHQPLQSFLARYRFNAPDQKADGLTPLMMACIEGCIPLVKELLSSKAEVNEKVEVSIRDIQLGGRQTALTVAAALSSSKVVQCLLQAKAALDVCCGTLCYTAIHQAAAYGNHAVIADLAAAAPELVHKPNSKGDTPIVNGVATHNSQVTEKLLEFGADPNQLGSYGHSVLALSSLHTSYVCHAEYLLRAGADPNYGGAPTRLWDSALLKQWETEVEKSELVGPSAGEPLLSFGIPIQIATESGNFEMAKLLYEYGAELPPKLVAATSLHSPVDQNTVTRRTSKWGGMVEVGWTFFKDAAVAKDRIVDLERELENKKEELENLRLRVERAELKAESATVKEKRMAQELSEASKDLEDYRKHTADLNQKLSFATASMESQHVQIAAQEKELKETRESEAKLQFELRRALKEEEHMGGHADFMATQMELGQAKQSLHDRRGELEVALKQLQSLRHEVHKLRAAEEQSHSDAKHLQCKDCAWLEQACQAQVCAATARRLDVEAALQKSLEQQQELRLQLLEERNRHEELKEVHSTRLAQAAQEVALLRQKVERQKQETRWRHPGKREGTIETPQLDTPRRHKEMLVRLEELLPGIQHPKSRTDHVYPKLVPQRSPKEVEGRSFVQEFVVESDRHKMQDIVDAALQGQETEHFEIVICSKDDQEHVILLNATPRRHRRGAFRVCPRRGWTPQMLGRKREAANTKSGSKRRWQQEIDGKAAEDEVVTAEVLVWPLLCRASSSFSR
eukprot:s2052_g15.t2